MQMNRREFVGAMAISLACTAAGFGHTASALSRASSRSVSAPGLLNQVERDSRFVNGQWRTSVWYQNRTGYRLEVGSSDATNNTPGVAKLSAGRIRISSRLALPHDYRFDEFTLGSPQHEIRQHFGDNVLQELLEEIERLRVEA